MKDITYIYGLVSTRNLSDVRYVGKTVNMQARLSEHKRRSKTKNSYVYRWINKELKENYNIKIIKIDEVWSDDWDFWEIYWIREYFKRGYKLTNLSPGGYQSDNMVEIYALSIDGKFIKNFNSIASAANYFNLSEKRIADNVRGLNRYTKDKIFIKAVEYNPEKDYSIDKSTRKDRWKAIYQFTLNGEFIQEWKGIIVAAKSMNISPCVISAALNNKQQSSGGYIWSYSPETPQSIVSENVLRQYNKSKGIIKIYNNKNYIGTCSSSKEIAEKYNIPVKNVYRVLCKDIKSTAGGYTFIRETEGALI